MHRFLQGRRREETKDLVLVLAEFVSLMSPTGRLAIKNSSGKNIGAMVVSVAETRKSHEGRYRLSHWLADGTLSDSTTNSQRHICIVSYCWDAYLHTQLLKYNITSITESLLLG